MAHAIKLEQCGGGTVGWRPDAEGGDPHARQGGEAKWGGHVELERGAPRAAQLKQELGLRTLGLRTLGMRTLGLRICVIRTESNSLAAHIRTKLQAHLAGGEACASGGAAG